MQQSFFLNLRSSARAVGAASLLGLAVLGATAGLGRADDQGAVQIASFGALTGPDAVYGVSSLNGQTLAVNEINAAGGVNGRKFALVQYDDMCQTTQAAVVASKIISDTSL